MTKRKMSLKKRKATSKSLAIIFSTLLLFILSLFLIFNPNNQYSSKMNKLEMLEGTEDDNWELSVVFYDSTVDNGTTPLTFIDWDASDGSYKAGQTRTITIQINYKNTNTMTTYNPGDLKIKIDTINPVSPKKIEDYYNSSYSIGANDSSHTGYDWNLVSANTQKIVLSNNATITSQSNVEGSIQIKYMLTPKSQTPVKYQNEILVEYDKEITATMYSDVLGDINSNTLTYHYRRLAQFEWKKQVYTFKKEAERISQADNLPNYEDYTWVKYYFRVEDGTNQEPDNYPNILANEPYITDQFPSDVIVLNHNYNVMTPDENGVYTIPTSDIDYSSRNAVYRFNTFLIVGYPLSNYLENDIKNISNSADLYMRYASESETELIKKATVNVDLSKMNYHPDGYVYDVYKSYDSGGSTSGKVFISSSSNMYYESLTGEVNGLGANGVATFTLSPVATYLGKEYDYKIGDDILYIRGSDNQYRRLEEDEYYFTTISFPNYIRDAEYRAIPDNSYHVSLYIKKKGQSDYQFHAEFDNARANNNRYTFTSEDEVTAFYFMIEGLEHSMIYGYDSETAIIAKVKVHDVQNIATSGIIYNFDYAEYFIDDEYQISLTSNKYPSFEKLNEIKAFDNETHGKEVVRFAAGVRYKKYTFPRPSYSMGMMTSVATPVNSSVEEKITSTSTTTMKLVTNRNSDFSALELENYTQLLPVADRVQGYVSYELLPKGMQITSTEEEILENFNIRYLSNITAYTTNGTKIPGSELASYFKSKSKVVIIKNWHNTGRTYLKVEIDLVDDPLLVVTGSNFYNTANRPEAIYKYNWTIPYDSLLENGEVYYRNVRVMLKNVDNGVSILNGGGEFGYYQVDATIRDDNGSGTGNSSPDEADMDEDGKTTDKTLVRTDKITVLNVVSTNQDVQTSVSNDEYLYDVNETSVERNANYEYKLRVRTGQNDVTNLVIYDSIEDYAKNPQLEIIKASDGKHYWQGEFLGVDTSYAESKGYTVKVYYNTNPNSGTLSEDNTWQEYTDETDKTTVKTLAFKYLDAEGNPAVLPANTNTYVLLKMKSPDFDYKTFTYNGCWTEWNALDPVTGLPVDFITGINSNIVRVALPNSVDPEDINITISKVWKDGNNVLGVRPDSINVKLIANDDYANAVEVPMTGTGNTWTTEVTVPRYDEDGETITYIVREDNLTVGEYEYIPTVEDYTITNSLNRHLTLSKNWVDNTNAYLTRPSNVTFVVKQNGNEYKTVTFGGLLTVNTWSDSITVPGFDEDGNAYNYTIDELSITGYATSCVEFTCTNTLTGNENITVKKVWVDNNNTYNTRPENISIRLKQNNSAYQSVTLTGTTDTWTSDEITVPKYDANGVKYTYTIEETPISKYGLVTYDQANLKITNTLKDNKAITITKNWVDDSNALGLRPDELTITLLQNGNDYQNITLTGIDDTWSTTIEVPKYDDNQVEYTYSIREVVDNVNEDYSNITYSEAELTVTNQLDKKANLKVTKIWDDGDNKALTRPESIKVNLLRNGDFLEELEIIPDDINENTWEIEIEDLDVYDANGAKYTYTIEENLEEQLERYETITYDQTNFTITNKLTVPPKVTLYFTVKNGYTLPGTEDILYDQEGYNDVLGRYNLNGEDEYTFHFELENVDTGEIIEGKLSTQGVLEFTNVPYGTYRAREGEDDYFDFVSMIEIEEVLGVTFKQDSRGGTITISPTGKDIVYGAKVTNKITVPVKNPETKTNHMFINILEIVLLLSFIIGFKMYKRYLFLK